MDMILAKIRDMRRACPGRCAPLEGILSCPGAMWVAKGVSRNVNGGRLVLRGGLEAYFSGGAT
jgi:hypothetical protein